MLLKIFSNNDIYLYTDENSTFFRTRSYGGMMYLQFDISTAHKLYKYLEEETIVEYDKQYYLVKSINERSNSFTSTINCELDLSGLNSKVYTSITFKTESFYNVCREILKDTGWSIKNAEMISKRTTLEITDSTPLEILQTCTNSTSYNTCYEFDTINKVITVIKPENNTNATGVYFTDELNLSELTFKGSSNGLVTRLYVYGKDGLSIASVNGGKEYIDNNTYTSKVIAQVWRDERYTNAQSLKDDAVVKLATLAVPQRSYTCKVVDLAKTNPKIYSNILGFDLYDIITLVDRNRNIRTDNRIVEVKEYPDNSVLNTVSLSTIAGRVTGKITTLENRITELNTQQLHDRTKVNEIKQDLDTTVLHISESWASSVNESMFTQTADGLFLQVDKIVGKDQWSTLVQQSAEDVRIAWNNCSKYIKFEQSQLNIYDDSDKKLMSLHSSGQTFYYKDYVVGGVGTTAHASDENKRGLIFALENGAKFLTLGYRENSTDSFMMKWTYTSEQVGQYAGEQLHAGCDINTENYSILNANLKYWSFEGGSISGTFKGYYITSFNSDGTANTWKEFELVFNRGILKSATW